MRSQPSPLVAQGPWGAGRGDPGTHLLAEAQKADGVGHAPKAAGAVDAAGPGVQESLRRVPGGHPQSGLAAQQGVGDPRALGRGLPDGLSADLSHDGAFTPQVLETEAQEAVNDEGCKQGMGIEPGPPTRPRWLHRAPGLPCPGDTDPLLMGLAAQPWDIPRGGGGGTAVPVALTPPTTWPTTSPRLRAGPAAAPPHLGSLLSTADLAIRRGPH